MDTYHRLHTLTQELHQELDPANDEIRNLFSAGEQSAHQQIYGLYLGTQQNRNLCREIIRSTIASARQTHCSESISGVFASAIRSQLQFAKTKIDISFDTEFSGVMNAPCEAIHAMINRLLKNSIQALNQEGGGRIRLSAQPRAASLLVDIEDDGPGIPDYILESLAARQFTPKENNAGIGLPVVAMLAKYVGGELIIMRSNQNGTLARLRIPATLRS
ncbi:MAG: ATP-binding protein [Pseudomonadota bacterium]